MTSPAWWSPALEAARVLERGWVLQAGSPSADAWLGLAADQYATRLRREQACVRRWAEALVGVGRAGELHATWGDEALETVRWALVSAATLDLDGRQHPGGGVPGLPADRTPTQVRAWWSERDRDEQWRLEVSRGTELGDRPGMPLDVRDRLNRFELRRDAGDGVVPKRVVEALAVPGRALWTYTPEGVQGDATAVVGVGDVGAAESVVVLVPGVGTEVEDAPGQLLRLDRVLDAGGHGSSLPASGDDVAAVWWLGYDAPDGPTDPAMVTRERARAGGGALAQEVEALELDRSDVAGERTTVVGHSYGSTVMGHALGPGEDRAGVQVDAAVFVGSPGAGDARSAADLRAREVYALRDRRDLVAMLGSDRTFSLDRLTGGRVGLGVDPTSEGFGARRLPSPREGGSPWPALGDAHSGYFDAGSQALEGLGRVIRGDADES